MAKVLRTAALIVGAVSLAATGFGAIAGLATIGAGTGVAGTLLGLSAGTLSSIGAIAAATAPGRCISSELGRRA